MRLRRPLVGATAALAALTLTACGSSGPAAPGAAAADGAVTVVASTNVYGAIAQAVGGDGVTVESIISDPAADPHSYESTPADAVTVAGADVVVLNGGGYDEFMPGLIAASGGEPVVVDVAELSGLEEAEEAAVGAAAPAEQDDRSHEGEAHSDEEAHAHGEFNEHVWYSLPTVAELAGRIATELGTVDAANAATYTANAETFAAGVTELQERVAGLGAGGGDVAVTEPIPGYLIETAGLTDVTPPEFAEAVEEDTDPPAAVVAETLALFTPGTVRALIVNAQTQTPTTDQVRNAAEAAGVPVVEMSETLPEGTDDYLAWMNAQVEALAVALAPV